MATITQVTNIIEQSDSDQLSIACLYAGFHPREGQDGLLMADAQQPPAKLMAALGGDAGSSITDLAFIPRDCVQTKATAIAAADLITLGKLMRLYDICTTVINTQFNTHQSGGHSVQKPSDAKGPSSAKSVKLSSYITAEVEGSADRLTQKEIKEAEGHYATKMGLKPTDQAMPSEEQLTALKAILDQNINPYVDFSIWGPHNTRFIKKKSQITSYAIDPETGLWSAKSTTSGPTGITMWSACFQVFRTAMVMLKAADPERLDQYSSFIKGLSERHGAGCWFLIYQADVRLRSEKIPKIVRNLDGVENRSKWALAFTSAIDMDAPGVSEFWNEQVHRPCQEFKSGATSKWALTRDDTFISLHDSDPTGKAQPKAKGKPKGGRSGRGKSSSSRPAPYNAPWGSRSNKGGKGYGKLQPARLGNTHADGNNTQQQQSGQQHQGDTEAWQNHTPSSSSTSWRPSVPPRPSVQTSAKGSWVWGSSPMGIKGGGKGNK